MKKFTFFKTLLVATMLMGGVNCAWADGWSDSDGATVGTGDFYFYNVGSERFLTQGCWWGTHMAADGAGKVITISGSENAYNLHMAGVNDNNWISGGDYTDTGIENEETITTDENLQWTFTLVDETSHTYTIKNNSTNKYLHADNSASGTAQYNTGYSVGTGESVTDNTYYWILIPRNTRETLTDVSIVYPIDATYKVTNPDGEWYIRYESEAWKEYSHGGWSGNFSHNSYGTEYYYASFYEIWSGDNATGNGNKVGNNWHLNNFDEYNNITDLPNGKYRITMAAEATQQGGDVEEITGAYIYANSNKTPVTTRGNYSVECTITDGTIKAGMKTVNTTANWVSFDNLRLTYLDPYVSALAEDLPSGGAMTAGKWYKYVVASDAEYTISATTAADIKVSSDVLLSEFVGSDVTTGDAVNLTAGTYFYQSASDNTLTIIINDPIQPNRDLIVSQKGDITSLINGDFQTNTDGWTGGSHITSVTSRGWRGDNATKFYETNTTSALSCTLQNMPAGTYKVVAAARGYDGGKITPEIAGNTGTTLNTIGDAIGANSTSEINTNGVEMPYSSLGGFTSDTYGHNWKWITVTGDLAADGDLVIKFKCEGSSWMCIDDVHLYCTSLNGTTYTRTVGDGKGTINTNNSVVTADIVMENPNTILRSTGKVTTAASQDLNNNQYNSNRITKLVLYDGYDFTNSGDNYGLDYGATLYRNIPANTWCSLVIPFYPTNLDNKKVPTSFVDGVLTFEDAPNKDMNDSPMLVRSSAGLTAITGVRNGTYGINKGTGSYGEGAPMIGVYESSNVPESTESTNYYVIGTDNELHKVIGDEVTINPFRAYFTLADANSAPIRISINFSDEESSAINNIEENKMQNCNIYNMSGQRVFNPTHGIYIMNGKKIFIK